MLRNGVIPVPVATKSEGECPPLGRVKKPWGPIALIVAPGSTEGRDDEPGPSETRVTASGERGDPPGGEAPEARRRNSSASGAKGRLPHCPASKVTGAASGRSKVSSRTFGESMRALTRRA